MSNIGTEYACHFFQNSSSVKELRVPTFCTCDLYFSTFRTQPVYLWPQLHRHAYLHYVLTYRASNLFGMNERTHSRKTNKPSCHQKIFYSSWGGGTCTRCTPPAYATATSTAAAVGLYTQTAGSLLGNASHNTQYRLAGLATSARRRPIAVVTSDLSPRRRDNSTVYGRVETVQSSSGTYRETVTPS